MNKNYIISNSSSIHIPDNLLFNNYYIKNQTKYFYNSNLYFAKKNKINKLFPISSFNLSSLSYLLPF